MTNQGTSEVFMLSVWEILPAQISLPSLVEVVGLLHNWIKSPSRPTAEWRSSLHVLVCAPYKFGAPDCILGPDLGHILVLVLGSIFGRGFGALDFVCNCRGPKRCPKMEPETGTKIEPKSGPQNAIRGSKFVRRRKQGRVEMIFIQRAVCLAILFNCATNQQLQPKKEGKLGRAKLLQQRAWIHSQTKHTGIHALRLRNFARPNFPSFFGWSCWFVAQLNRQADRPLNEDHLYTSLFVLLTNLGPRIAFWGLIWVIFWSLFWVPFLGAVLGPWILFVIVGAQNGAQKWNPKQGPK